MELKTRDIHTTIVVGSRNQLNSKRPNGSILQSFTQFIVLTHGKNLCFPVRQQPLVDFLPSTKMVQSVNLNLVEPLSHLFEIQVHISKNGFQKALQEARNKVSPILPIHCCLKLKLGLTLIDFFLPRQYFCCAWLSSFSLLSLSYLGNKGTNVLIFSLHRLIRALQPSFLKQFFAVH